MEGERSGDLPPLVARLQRKAPGIMESEDNLALTGRAKRLGFCLCFRFIRIFGF